MSSFGKIKAALDTAGRTAEFELTELDETPKPVLILRPAGIDNREFFNEALRSGAATVKAMRGKTVSDAEQVEIGLQEMRTLWPRLVIAGWRGLKDDEGSEPPYSEALCREFLEALPTSVLIRLKKFGEDMANFRPQAGAPIDAGLVAGN